MGQVYDYPTCPACGKTIPNGYDDFDGHHDTGEAVGLQCGACGHCFRMRAVSRFEVVECECGACKRARGEGA